MTLSTLSWNIAAVNNNPFEYFLTHLDPKYVSLMEGVEGFIEAPGDRDIPVGSVFTQAMYDDLAERMQAQGWGVAPIAAVWSSDLSQRTIVTGFLKDKALGAKRLMSMPDRFTNTIDLAGGGVANRPCITSNFDGDMSTLPKWWAAVQLGSCKVCPCLRGSNSLATHHSSLQRPGALLRASESRGSRSETCHRLTVSPRAAQRGERGGPCDPGGRCVSLLRRLGVPGPQAWAAFMFETSVEVAVKGGGTATKRPCELLSRISRAKYPALSEEEEAMSVPLQARTRPPSASPAPHPDSHPAFVRWRGTHLLCHLSAAPLRRLCT